MGSFYPNCTFDLLIPYSLLTKHRPFFPELSWVMLRVNTFTCVFSVDPTKCIAAVSSQLGPGLLSVLVSGLWPGLLPSRFPFSTIC
jgi:hypothetical protein